MSQTRRFALLTLLLGMLAVVLTVPLLAQDNTIYLAVGGRSWYSDDSIFDDFEAANPGVQVIIADDYDPLQGQEYDPDNPPNPLDTAEVYATHADVLFVDLYQLSPEYTRAGYYLDLAPVIAGDPNFNEADYFNSAWNAFQWDGGFWALPGAVASVNMVLYQPTVFDEAGLPYPDESWQLEDFINAAETLSTTDENGDPVSGLFIFNYGPFIRSLTGQDFFDTSVEPGMPRLNTPEVAALLQQYVDLQEEGIINQTSGDPFTTPLTVGPTYPLTSQFGGPGGEEIEYAVSLLPGGVSAVDGVNGVAVSAGTQYPDLAVELAKYLVNSPRASELFYGDFPARRDELNDPDSERFVNVRDFPDLVPVFEQALDNAITGAELYYASRLNEVFGQLYEAEQNNEAADIQTLLDELQANIEETLAEAEARNATPIEVFVPTPTPLPDLAQGQSFIRFGLGLYYNPLPNQAEWDRFIEEFIANTPEIVGVDLLEVNVPPEEYAENFDCMYVPYSFLSYAQPEQLQQLLPLDPFMQADSNFNADDFLPATLEQGLVEGTTYGLPVDVQADLIRYDADLFEQVGAVDPSTGWTVEQFNEALQLTQPQMVDEQPAFDFGSSGFSLLPALIASYGGMPIDRSTTPPTLNLTDPQTVEAIRQVLDLAKEGYIRYNPFFLTEGGMGGGSMMMGGDEVQGPAMTGESMNSLQYEINNFADDFESSSMRFTTYPRGSRYTPFTYNVGMGFVTSGAQDPESCYKLLSQMTQRPELTLSMPARYSVLEGQAIEAISPKLAEFYQAFAAGLNDPTALVVQNYYQGEAGLRYGNIDIFLYRAFDRYVIEDADLDEELAQAQDFMEQYIVCAENAPEADPETEEYYTRFQDCLIEVDPSLEGRFGGNAIS